jgi:tRNA(fMet)-specific endonuclease VapC
MIGSEYLLDTCIIIDHFRNSLNGLRLETLTSLNVSSTTIGELYFGAYRSANPVKHLQKLVQFVEICTVYKTDENTAKIYGLIKAQLAKKGKPIPENDMWIAACALQHNFTLYTSDQHFKEIDSLSLTTQ